MSFIDRFNADIQTRVEFKGGPSPRVPDSIFIPRNRPTVLPLAVNSIVVNKGFGFVPAPYLHNAAIPREVPFNIINGSTIVNIPTGRNAPGNTSRVTIRKGAPPSLSTVAKPVG